MVSYGLKNWKVDQSDWGQSEIERYNRGVQQVQKYDELTDFLRNMHELYWEMRNLHLILEREEASINIWDKRSEATPQFLQLLDGSMHKYLRLCEEIKENKEWHEKVKTEIGYYIHFMYNTLCTTGNYEFFKDFVTPPSPLLIPSLFWLHQHFPLDLFPFKLASLSFCTCFPFSFFPFDSCFPFCFKLSFTLVYFGTSGLLFRFQ